MAAAPQYATAVLKSVVDGRVYNVDVYLSDVASALANWDSGNGASSSSLTFYKVPTDSILVDFSIKTGMTDTTFIQVLADGAVIPNSTLRYANYLNTLTTRPAIQIGFRAGTNLGFIQRA